MYSLKKICEPFSGFVNYIILCDRHIHKQTFDIIFRGTVNLFFIIEMLLKKIKSKKIIKKTSNDKIDLLSLMPHLKDFNNLKEVRG